MKRTLVAVTGLVVLAAGVTAPTGASTQKSWRADAALAQYGDAVDVAQARVEGLAKRSDADGFEPLRANADSVGGVHVRFTQTYKGLTVVGGEVITHQRANGTFEDDTVAGLVQYDMKVDPAISRAAAADVARQYLSTTRDALDARLVIVSGAYFGTADGSLAWKLRFATHDAAGPHLWSVYVDASDSARGVILLDDGVKTTSAAGTGNSLYAGSVTIYTDSASGSYRLVDTRTGRTGTLNTTNKQGGYNYTTDAGGQTDRFLPRPQGTLITGADNLWGSGTSAVETDAVDATFGGATTYDFYKTVLGRNGIWNDGSGSISRVNYSRNYNNAFWADDLAGMSYGRGDGRSFGPLTSIDVCGHEMTHGVTYRTANLTYSGESGGLNEAMSDCIGASVEQWADSPTGGNVCNAPASNPFKYWEIGEQCYTPRGSTTDALRYMYDPAKDGGSKNEWYSGVGSLDVHYSSGPLNLAFYLTSEGGRNPRRGSAGLRADNTTNYPQVTGIGYQQAALIWYNGLLRMTSSTNYAGARAAMLAAATSLYGANTPQYNAVAAAFTNINVL